MSNENILVTVGMPIYNGGTYISDAIESVLKQTHKNIRVLIFDNASTDDTANIIEYWAVRDSRVLYQRHATNVGATRNFELLLENADSKYFCYAAHDDRRSENYIECLLGAMTRHRSAKLAVAKCIRLAEDGSEMAVHDIQEREINQAVDPEILMRVARSWWVYGLWETDHLRRSLSLIERFGHGWGAEYIAMLPLFLACGIAASNDAVFYQRMANRGSAEAQPKTPLAQWRIYRDFIAACCEISGEPDRSFSRFAAARVGGPKQIRRMIRRKIFTGRYLKR